MSPEGQHFESSSIVSKVIPLVVNLSDLLVFDSGVHEQNISSNVKDLESIKTFPELLDCLKLPNPQSKKIRDRYIDGSSLEIVKMLRKSFPKNVEQLTNIIKNIILNKTQESIYWEFDSLTFPFTEKSIQNYREFWEYLINDLRIEFDTVIKILSNGSGFIPEELLYNVPLLRYAVATKGSLFEAFKWFGSDYPREGEKTISSKLKSTFLTASNEVYLPGFVSPSTAKLNGVSFLAGGIDEHEVAHSGVELESFANDLALAHSQWKAIYPHLRFWISVFIGSGLHDHAKVLLDYAKESPGKESDSEPPLFWFVIKNYNPKQDDMKKGMESIMILDKIIELGIPIEDIESLFYELDNTTEFNRKKIYTRINKYKEFLQNDTNMPLNALEFVNYCLDLSYYLPPDFEITDPMNMFGLS